jgi:hypothetical protein
MFNEFKQIIPLYGPADAQAGGITTDSIDMSKLNGVEILIIAGAITGSTQTVQFYAGATNGAETTELFPKTRVSGANVGSTGSDVFAAGVTTPAGGVVPVATRIHRVMIPADQMPAGMPFLTLQIEDGDASVLLLTVIAIGEPRYEGATHVTAV